MQYKCKAIVLKTTKLGESDKILNLYSPGYGPIRAVAKGARKSSSGFGGRAQVLSYCDFLIGKGRNLDIISQAKLIEDFDLIRTDYDSLTFACFMVDVIDSISIHDDCYEDHFNLLLKSLTELNNINASAEEEKKNRYLLASIKFLWELIGQLGYKPELNRCCLTGLTKHPSQTAKYFNLRDGGIVSTQAFMDYEVNNPYQNDIYAINSRVYKILQYLDSNMTIENILEGDLQDTFKLLHKHLEYRMHKEFKSWKLLEPCL